MDLMNLNEYEEIKGKLETKEDAFRQGQLVAFAYMADCIDISLSFGGLEGVVKKIESARRMNSDYVFVHKKDLNLDWYKKTKAMISEEQI